MPHFRALILTAGVVVGCAAETEALPRLAERFPGEGRYEDGWVTEYRLASGVRWMEDSAVWSGLDQLLAVDLDYHTRPIDWPVSVALGLHTAWGSATSEPTESSPAGDDYDVQIWEICAGARRGERFGPLELHYGLGGVFGIGRLQGGPFDANDTVAGAYAQVGLTYAIADRWLFGLDGRYVLTEKLDLDLAPETAALTAITALASVGVRF